VSGPAAPAPPAGEQQWQLQYAEGVRRAQLGAQVYQQSMQGAQQIMSNLFPNARR